jgi:hypothetical protein
MKKIVLLLSFCLSFILGYSQYDLSKNIDRQVMVVPQKGMESQTQAFIQRSNAQIVANFEQLGWYVVLLPENLTQDSFVRSSKDLPFIKEVYKDQKVEMKLDYIPNDVEFNQCWHLRQTSDKDIDADEAWDLVPANNPTVSVAMFDGGLDLTIPDLAANTTNPFNAVNSTTNIPYVNAEDKHGTTCSGTIAAVTNNGIGVSSVGNNKVKVMPVNIMSQVFAGGSFSTSDVIQINGVNAAMANPTCVAIAMSYGGSSYSSALDAAFQAARTTARGGKGMVVVASSGNGYSGTAAQYPANYSGVWGIGATSTTDLRASFSNFGQICDISAPGTQIRTTDRIGAAGYGTGDYTSISGTSFSCPIFATSAAFVFYKNWELTDDQVLQILSQTAEKVGGYTYSNNPTWPLSTRSNELGYGRINLKDAINATPNPGGTPPPPPTLVHNFVINTLTVNPTPVSAGGTINISCTVATQNPTYSSVNVMTQYRVSINTTWGDGDDIIVGTTSGNLGGGVTTDIETLTYNVGTSTGTRYLLARVNYMGTVSETNSNDNTSTSTFVINQVTQTGTDALSYFAVPLTPSITTNLQSQSFRWGIKNNGTTTITSLGYRRGWVNCPPSAGPWATPCVQTFTWTGTILPGQTVFLPSSTGWTSVNLCFSSTSCAIPLGGTNTYFFEILTVNGVPDSNVSNNYSQCVVTRTATATNNNDNSDIEYVEVRVSSRLYENPIRYNNLDEAILEKGLNFIYIHHSDGSIEIKKIFIN